MIVTLITLVTLVTLDNNPSKPSNPRYDITTQGTAAGVNEVSPHNCLLLQDVMCLWAIQQKWEHIKPFFANMDTNHDMVISRAEFREKMAGKLSPALIENFFNSLDTNHDATLTYEVYICIYVYICSI